MDCKNKKNPTVVKCVLCVHHNVYINYVYIIINYVYLKLSLNNHLNSRWSIALLISSNLKNIDLNKWTDWPLSCSSIIVQLQERAIHSVNKGNQKVVSELTLKHPTLANQVYSSDKLHWINRWELMRAGSFFA